MYTIIIIISGRVMSEGKREPGNEKGKLESTFEERRERRKGNKVLFLFSASFHFPLFQLFRSHFLCLSLSFFPLLPFTVFIFFLRLSRVFIYISPPFQLGERCAIRRRLSFQTATLFRLHQLFPRSSFLQPGSTVPQIQI